ncbi:MAG: metallophosphoesterase [Lachnospiraceae bacterium]|nr:metallophosphoesterase [Lachnospiraceae bacterium]
MKIIVVSDTHGELDRLFQILDAEAPYDMVIHCGDICGGYERLRDKVDCTLHAVAGNMDYDPDMDRIREFDIGNYKAIVTHGHRYRLYDGYDPLYYLAAENQADFVFFGHTHIPVIHEEGPVTLINPGSLSYPRQHGRQPSYIIGTAENGKKPEFEIRYV